jgi:hypothetical protein
MALNPISVAENMLEKSARSRYRESRAQRAARSA